MRQIKTCLNCEERHIGCHAKCEKYLSAKAQQDRVEDRRKADNNLRNEFVSIRLRDQEKRRRSGRV